MGKEITNLAKDSIEGIGKYASDSSKKKAANAVINGGIFAVIGLGLGALISIIADSAESTDSN